jgi:hypothetical protein
LVAVRHALALALVCAAAATASAQTLTLHVDSRELYAGMPFVLSVEAKGFEEKPEPKLSAFTIPGARVTYLGVAPNVSTMVQVINGVASQSRDVSFVYRYRVEVKSAGTFNIAPITAEQGSRHAETHAARFQTLDIDRTNDMRVRLVLPNRPLWVGETFDVNLDWYLRRDVGNRTFVVPLFDAPGVSVAPPRLSQGQRTLAFAAGAKEIELPFERSQATLDGTSYTRFRFAARVTVESPGTLDLLPTRVIAGLEVGQGRDVFGFPAAQQRLFKAEDAAQKLEIRPLPLSGRPASFRNAVGSAFAIDVQANRTVVSVGEPIELKVAVHGKGRLDGLLLPPLDADGGLSAKLFSWPDESAAGETIDDGKGKLFRVLARLKSTEAREIPPLALSYFDPELGQYRTTRSQPIALSVRGASVVAAKDVVRTQDATVSANNGAIAPIALSGVDLSLSTEDRTLARALSMTRVRPLVAVLYALPILLCGVLLWRRRTQAMRDVGQQSRTMLRALEQAIGEARQLPAKDGAPRVARALTDLARQLAVASIDYQSLLERLETESFDPRAANEPIAAARLDELLALAQTWCKRTTPRASAVSAAVWLVIAASLAAGLGARAAAGDKLADARAAYRAALQEKDRDRRTHAFAGAEATFRELTRAYPDRPELLTDWGNAALGAEDLGQATLAYRRALRLQPDLARARANLAWARRQLPSWVPQPREGGAAESLFFWHRFLSRPQRHVTAALFFALALVLFSLGGATSARLRLVRRAAAAPFVVWLVLVVSLASDHDPSGDAVLTADAVTLRSADSIGAPAVFDKQLLPGTECTILEKRDAWLRIQLADGVTGWVSAGGIEPITSDERPAS